MHWRRKWQPTPVFLPGESQGRGSLVAVYGVAQSRTRLKRLSSSSSLPVCYPLSIRATPFFFSSFFFLRILAHSNEMGIWVLVCRAKAELHEHTNTLGSEWIGFIKEKEYKVLSIDTEQRRQWQPTPVLLPGKSHGRRSLGGCSPWGR